MPEAIIVVIPGGSAELRKKLTVGGKQCIEAESVDLLVQRAAIAKQLQAEGIIEDAEKFTITDLPQTRFTSGLMAATHRIQKAQVLAFLKSWTLDEPIPTAETIDEMDTDVFDVLSKAASEAMKDARNALNLEPGLKEDGSVDRTNPTQTSNDSTPLSETGSPKARSTAQAPA